MSVFNLDNVKTYWMSGEDCAIFPWTKVMTIKTFWRVYSVFSFTGEKSVNSCYAVYNIIAGAYKKKFTYSKNIYIYPYLAF